MLKTQDPSDATTTEGAATIPPVPSAIAPMTDSPQQPLPNAFDDVSFQMPDLNMSVDMPPLDSGFGTRPATNLVPELDLGLGPNEFTWDMISLGLEEPLPSQQLIDEL